MALLRSYVGGAWVAPAGDGRPVFDAVTGEEVARVSSAGIDMAAALEYGRRTGGPALRALTFHQRAALLKSLGAALREHREELYALSARAGSTLYDAKFDVDGGIGVLLSYASKARRELPNDTVYVEGAAEPLGRGGQFLGQHILTPLHGVAVQINAFNFPVWGPLEKFAPAFIAGMPSLVKPASQTAYLTARLVELIVDSGLLPEGSLQLVCGGAGDLLDHLGEQDLVAFTGSAATARTLRAHPAVIARSVRFNAEADSLNCSILGPDSVPGTPEFDLFVKQLIAEMTVKAGQKCTAIRRALVPGAVAGEVTDAVSAALAGVVVGNPAEQGVRMGALASRDQLAEVRRSVSELLPAGRLVFGDPDRVEVVGADPGRGAFISPLLLRCDDATRAEPHEVEAFGPVSTVIGYRDAADVVRARGPRPGEPGRVGGHRRPRVRPRGGDRAGALARPDPGARPRRRGRVDRPRVPAARAGARRPRAGRRRRGDGRHPRRAAPHAAHRRPGQPADAGHRDRPMGPRRAAEHRCRAPVPQAALRAEAR